MSLRRALTVIVLLLVSGRSAVAAEPTIQVTEPAGIFIAPDNARQPLIQATAGMTLTLVRPEGIWLMVAWQDERFGRRTGYIEARFTDYAANRAAIARNTGPQVPVAARTESLPAAPVAAAPAPVPGRGPAAAPSSAAPVANTGSLRSMKRLYIEKMQNDLDQYIAAEITKQINGRVVVVLDKANADAIMRGVSENKTGVGAAVTGRYLGLHDNANASITVVDPAETIVLWASEAGDRSLMWGALARGGQRKVASRLVSNLKKAIAEAK